MLTQKLCRKNFVDLARNYFSKIPKNLLAMADN